LSESFNVTPSSAPVTEFDALDTLTPSTVSFASCAACVCVRFCVPAGSYPSRLASAASPLTPMRTLCAAPVVVLVKVKRYGVPLPSLMMLARTPILAALIASRMPCSELFELSMVTVPELCVPSCVKVAPV
jgi:hypothetical protein